MRLLAVPILIVAVAALPACKRPEAPTEARPVRTMAVQARLLEDDRQAVGEVRPRYESELSFRVAGKVLARLVDVGAAVRQGDTLAKLDTQDYENRLRSAEAEVASAEAALVEAQAEEARKAKLLKDGWTPRATYDSVVRNLRAAEARLTAAKANLELSRDQLRYTELKAEFDGVITAVGAEAGQNVIAGQMVVKLARPSEMDGVFNIAETLFAQRVEDKPGGRRLACSPIPSSRSRARSARSRRSPMPRRAPTPSRSRSRTRRPRLRLRHEPRRPRQKQVDESCSSRLSAALRQEPACRRSGSSILRAPLRCGRSRSLVTRPTRSSSRAGLPTETSSSPPAPIHFARASACGLPGSQLSGVR